jgi:hypothetical protein
VLAGHAGGAKPLDGLATLQDRLDQLRAQEGEAKAARNRCFLEPIPLDRRKGPSQSEGLGQPLAHGS